MSTIEQQVADAEQLVEYARRNGIALPDGTFDVIAKARAKLPGLASPGPDNTAFLQALKTAAAAVPFAPASLVASLLRQTRLAPMAKDAQVLLEFAAANSKKVDDENRKALLASIEAINKGTPSLENEQAFFKSYEALTTATAPVTADTIAASQTKLPSLRVFLQGKDNAWNGWENLTLGRFFDAMIFVLVLVATGVALGYHSVGSEAAKRLKDLDVQLATTAIDIAKNADLAKLRSAVLERKKAEKPSFSTDVLEADQKALDDAQRDLTTSKALKGKLDEERNALPGRLWHWSQQPCALPMVKVALCSSVDAVASGQEPNSDIARVAPATTVIGWMNQVVLPLLLGWLGSYAYVVRRMTADISAMAFAKASTLRHITRLALGALAGIASGWLLTPEAVSGQLKNTPAWVLAFVAGYGIELVFEFMDRIIGAFTTKTT